MTKGTSIFQSILLILSAALIFFLNRENTTIDSELVGFFEGFILIAGIGLLIRAIIPKKK